MKKKSKVPTEKPTISINLHDSNLSQGVIIGSTNPIQHNYEEVSTFHKEFAQALVRLETALLNIQKQLTHEQAQVANRELQMLKSEVAEPRKELKQVNILTHLDRIKNALAGISSAGIILKQLYDLAVAFFPK